MSVHRSLTVCVYGESKVGKSTLAATAPYPRLMLDVEGGHRFLPINVRYWDPLREVPPIADGTWDTCVVMVRDYATVLKAYEWLQSGQHHFASLIIDSISELQVKCQNAIVSMDEQMKLQQWGELLRSMGDLLRNVRDLTMHPTKPLEAVVLTAMAKPDKDGRYKPYLQGQIAIVVPYLYDILGYLAVETFQHPDPTQGTFRARRMHLVGSPVAEAGERVQGRLGEVVEQQNLEITKMLDIVFGPKPEVPAPAVIETTTEGTAA